MSIRGVDTYRLESAFSKPVSSSGVSSFAHGLEKLEGTTPEPTKAEDRSAGEAFAEALVRAGVDAARSEERAADSVKRFANDEDVNIHDVVVDVEKAEVSLKLMVSMRNRLIEAYREVMKMGM
ncbi:MAG: flagellar hook-basal body complex protein FliE [Deltaproteobacteria bacterium]|nr:flagellar hook-basal body complex protein FliE [Deltaproteobacteria bacterium]